MVVVKDTSIFALIRELKERFFAFGSDSIYSVVVLAVSPPTVYRLPNILMHNKKLSKFLSLILRHKPEVLGITLDPQGWASTKEIIEKMQAQGKQVSLQDLQEVVANNDKQRFKLSEDSKRIRANQGHSITVDLQLTPRIPPTTLYHGTATKNLGLIFQQGLLKRKRTHVHLSKDKETAIKVGQRHGTPVVLWIDAQQMQEDGFVFYLSENGVWLTEHVPVKYIRILE